MSKFTKILIANRGEIALRIMRTTHRLGYSTVAVYSDADTHSPHVRAADCAVRIGGASPSDSYLNTQALIAAAKQSGADAVHPGYGFLSENAAFAQAVIDAGLVWIGPSPACIASMGNKAAAKETMRAFGLPILEGYAGADQGDAAFEKAAKQIGFPLMVKAAAGGGGRGMRLVRTAAELVSALASARAESLAAFASDELILERAVINPRHIEIQILADAHGNCVALGERDCSVQRRHQKLIEEAPSPCPLLTPTLHAKMSEVSVQAARSLGYSSVGTMEFLLSESGEFFFMEMNTRLQVEHAVTEAIYDLDLVEWQLRVATGEALDSDLATLKPQGHAIEVRLTAEDVSTAFLPQSGDVLLWQAAAQEMGIRIEHGLNAHDVVSPHYDSMLAKLIAHGKTREEAIRKLKRALVHTTLLGVTTNQDFLSACLDDVVFSSGEQVSTAFIAERLPHLLPKSAPLKRTLEFAALVVAHVRGTTVVNLSWALGNGQTERAQINAGQLLVTNPLLTSHQFSAALDGVVETCHYAISNHELHFRHAAKTWVFDLTPPRKAALGKASGAAVLAPMTGRVTQVLVVAGDKFEAGQALVKIEAMKMEHSVSAPSAGVVSAVLVSAGAQVARGALLVSLQ